MLSGHHLAQNYMCLRCHMWPQRAGIDANNEMLKSNYCSNSTPFILNRSAAVRSQVCFTEAAAALFFAASGVFDADIVSFGLFAIENPSTLRLRIAPPKVAVDGRFSAHRRTHRSVHCDGVLSTFTDSFVISRTQTLGCYWTINNSVT